MRGRVYDSSIARFITADPNIFHPFDPQDFNRYSYVRNNPLKYTDPSGYEWGDGDGRSEEDNGGGCGCGASSEEEDNDAVGEDNDGNDRDEASAQRERDRAAAARRAVEEYNQRQAEIAREKEAAYKRKMQERYQAEKLAQAKKDKQGAEADLTAKDILEKVIEHVLKMPAAIGLLFIGTPLGKGSDIPGSSRHYENIKNRRIEELRVKNLM